MAITVISGLITSTLLTLLVVPVMYSLLDRRRERSGTEEQPSIAGVNESTPLDPAETWPVRN
jgi:HAE1 family hydrophobic/amphiphilic exporter-1